MNRQICWSNCCLGRFLLHTGTLAWCMLCPCIRLSVCHKSALSKWLSILSRKQSHTIADGLYLCDTVDMNDISMKSAQQGRLMRGDVEVGSSTQRQQRDSSDQPPHRYLSSHALQLTLLDARFVWLHPLFWTLCHPTSDSVTPPPLPSSDI